MSNSFGYRLSLLINELGLNVNSFSKAIGINNNVTIGRIINEDHTPSYKVLVSILEKFPQVDVDWLVIGSGDILKTKSYQKVTVYNDPTNSNQNSNLLVPNQKVHKRLPLVQENEPNKYTPIGDKLYIPYFPSQNFSLLNEGAHLEQYPRYLIPGLRKADFIIHYYSEDMHPTVMAGNYIAGKMVKISALNSWGRIHLFELEDHGVLMGRLKTGSDNNYVRCEPENPSFGTIEFEIDRIVAVARLMAVIKIL